MPKTESAAGTARAISRLLRRSDFKMADTSDKFRWTEGWHVSRVGYSGTVSVDYYIPGVLTDIHGSIKDRRRAEREKGFKFLQEKGYIFSQPGYIECQGE